MGRLPDQHSRALAMCRAATTRIERADAALALAGLTWEQFERMTGCKRAHLHGAHWDATARRIADYTQVGREWLDVGMAALDGVTKPPPKPDGMADADYEDLRLMLALLGYRAVTP